MVQATGAEGQGKGKGRGKAKGKAKAKAGARLDGNGSPSSGRQLGMGWKWKRKPLIRVTAQEGWMWNMVHNQGVPHTQAESLSIAIMLIRLRRQTGSNSKADKKRIKKKNHKTETQSAIAHRI